MQDSLGWGIVGTGRIATGQIAPSIQDLPNCRLRHVVSRDQQRAAAFAARFGGDSASVDYLRMLSDPEVDAVYLATPNSLHAEQVIAAARAGKHVLCDKPLATSVEDARRAVEECARAGVRLGVMFQSRRYEGIVRARTLVAEGAIGPVVSGHAQISSGRTLLSGWRTDPDLAGVGSLNNVGVHAFDLLRYLLGDEIVEAAAMLSREPGFVLDTTALALLRFASGALISVDANQSVGAPRPDLALFGTEGSILGTNVTRPGLSGTLTVTRADGTQSEEQVSSEGAFAATIDHFTEAVRHGREPSPSGADGLASVVLTQALYQAADEGCTVKVGP